MHLIFDEKGWGKEFASDCMDLVFIPINSLRSEIEQDINPITELHLDLVCFLSASQITFDWQCLSTGQLLRRQSRGNQFLAQICNPGNP